MYWYTADLFGGTETNCPAIDTTICKIRKRVAWTIGEWLLHLIRALNCWLVKQKCKLPISPCNGKQQQLLTLQVSSSCCLPLQFSTGVWQRHVLISDGNKYISFIISAIVGTGEVLWPLNKSSLSRSSGCHLKLWAIVCDIVPVFFWCPVSVIVTRGDVDLSQLLQFMSQKS